MKTLLILSAILFMQLPLFIHNYQEQLIGHVDELKWQVHEMELNAKLSNKTLKEYTLKFLEHRDKDVSRLGLVMQKVQMRFEKLSKALVALQNATPFTRPWKFISSLQWTLLKSTIKTFQPGIPITLEGMSYAIFGVVFSFLSILVPKTILKFAFRKSLILK